MEHWISAVSGVVSAFGTIAAAIGTIWIAHRVNEHSERLAKLQTRQNINNELKAFNLAILTNPEVAAFVAARRGHGIDLTMAATAVHFRMNVLSDMFMAQQEKIVPDAMREYQFSDWVHFLTKTYPDGLKHILDDDTLLGHDWRFMAAFIDALPNKFLDDHGLKRANLHQKFVVEREQDYAAATASISSSHASS